MALLNFVICERFHFHNIHTENILFGRPLSVGRSEMLDVQNFNISKPPYIAEVRRGSYPVGLRSLFKKFTVFTLHLSLPPADMFIIAFQKLLSNLHSSA